MVDDTCSVFKLWQNQCGDERNLYRIHLKCLSKQQYFVGRKYSAETAAENTGGDRIRKVVKVHKSPGSGKMIAKSKDIFKQ